MRIPPHIAAQIEAATKAQDERDRAEADRLAHAQAEAERKRQEYLQNYPALRSADIQRAMARRISAGDAGMPFAVIDTIMGSASTGDEKGQVADLGAAMESTKDQLWLRCRHLGGDAVLFARFSIERGTVAFTSYTALAANAISGVFSVVLAGGSKSLSPAPTPRFDTTVKQEVLTIIGVGTVVKLFPVGTQVSPQMYD